MSVMTIEGVVKDGQIRLAGDARLVEGTKVYVVVPDAQPVGRVKLYSPRLVHREQAKELVIEMLEEDTDA